MVQRIHLLKYFFICIPVLQENIIPKTKASRPFSRVQTELQTKSGRNYYRLKCVRQRRAAETVAPTVPRLQSIAPAVDLTLLTTHCNYDHDHSNSALNNKAYNVCLLQMPLRSRRYNNHYP